MRIARLALRNWGPFYGDHVLELDAATYAVIARKVGNNERSNYLGKTKLFESVKFALYGTHRHRLEDMWISDGEQEGFVHIVTDEGHEIQRSRKRGKTTRLSCRLAGEEKAAAQAEAERLIEKLVGINQEDFNRICYFEQRQMARFILENPEKRMEAVSGWLDLAPLEKAEEMHRERASKISLKLEDGRKLEARARQELELIESSLKCLPAVVSAQKYAEMEGAYAKCEATLMEDALRIEARDLLSEIKRLKEEASKEKTEGAEKDLRKSLDDAILEVGKLGDAIDTASLVARGEFDGICPVARIKCPARAEINKSTAENERRLKVLEADFIVAVNNREHIEYESALFAEANENLANKRAAWKRAAARLKEIGQHRATEALSDIDVDELDNLREEIADAKANARSRARDEARLKDEIDRKKIEIDDLELKNAGLENELELERAAVVIFGKQGAQRRVAEPALESIREEADAILAEAGIDDLSVIVEWSRTGDKLATTCDQCGFPYPASQKVKECARCASPRGLHLINKLDVRPSSASGAGEDLAGIAFQLAAGAWLRTARESPWSAVFLDEPFAQCDRANRKSLAVAVNKMVRGRLGFDQAFVISHSPDTNMSSRTIEIVSDNKRATVRVL